LWRVALFALLAVGLLAGLPYVKGLPPLVGTLVATVLFLLLALLIIHDLARLPLAPLYDLAGVVIGLGAWFEVSGLARHHATLRPLLGAASGVLFLLACVFCGRLLSLIVRERNILLPVAIMAGLADLYTVFFGFTGKTLAHAPRLVEKLSVGIPKVGSATGATGGAGLSHIATAGLGDFIFLAFFFVAVHRFQLRDKRTFWAIFGCLLAGMVAVLLIPSLPALPLLPFIVVGFLVANAGAFKLSRTEKINTAIVVALVAVLLVAAGLLTRGR
jgi:prepilin signal peptidase PulO-like enzyme (type II secretory pathway)